MPPRVVSLLSSATEIVSALGCHDWLVGRSHECDYPADVRSLPVCSEPTIDIHGTSREIDDRVKNSLRNALSIYRVHAERLQELRPDVILTQTQCEVCAVSLSDVQEAVCKLIDSRPQIVSVEPQDLAGVWDSIRQIATALNLAEQGALLVSQLESRMGSIQERGNRSGRRPTIACLEWLDPIMAAGNWGPELVEIAGGTNLLSENGKHSGYLTWEQLRTADPEVIVALPCGWDIPKGCEELSNLANHPEWNQLQAVRNHRVYVADGNQYFNRPGPRLVESTEILLEILHPELGNPRHQNTGWTNAQGSSQGH